MRQSAPPLNASETLTLGLAVQELVYAFGSGTPYLFGSRARGTARLDSDMDILFLFRSPTPPQQGVMQALDQVQTRVAQRGGQFDLGIQLEREERFEEAVFEEPYLKTAVLDLYPAKDLVLARLNVLPEGPALRAALQSNRPIFSKNTQIQPRSKPSISR